MGSQAQNTRHRKISLLFLKILFLILFASPVIDFLNFVNHPPTRSSNTVFEEAVGPQLLH